MSVIDSRFTSFAENFVICCNQITKIFCSKTGSASAFSARSQCFFGPHADVAVSVLREVSINIVLLPDTTFLWEDGTRQGCQGLHSRECAGYLSPTSWKKKVKSKRMKRKMGEKMDSKE